MTWFERSLLVCTLLNNSYLGILKNNNNKTNKQTKQNKAKTKKKTTTTKKRKTEREKKGVLSRIQTRHHRPHATHYTTKDVYVFFAESLNFNGFSMELPSANAVHSLSSLWKGKNRAFDSKK